MLFAMWLPSEQGALLHPLTLGLITSLTSSRDTAEACVGVHTGLTLSRATVVTQVHALVGQWEDEKHVEWAPRHQLHQPRPAEVCQFTWDAWEIYS